MKRIKSMSRIIALTLCAALTAVLLTGCVTVNFFPALGGGVAGAGALETYKYNVGEITGIKVDIFCKIEYYSSPSDTVTLEVQPNLRDYIMRHTSFVISNR